MALARVLLLGVAVIAASCVATYPDGRVGMLHGEVAISGRDEFARACAACHGADGRGGGPVAAELRTPPADLTVLAARAGGCFPREHVIGILNGEVRLPAHGSREMPVWSERFGPGAFGATAAASIYARRRLEAITDYVQSIQRPADGVE